MIKKPLLFFVFFISALISSAQFDVIYPYDPTMPVIDSCIVLNYTDMGYVNYKKDSVYKQVIATKAIQNGFTRTFSKVAMVAKYNVSLTSPVNKPIIEMRDTIIPKKDSTFYNFICDELAFENERYLAIKQRLTSVKTTKTIGIVITSGGALLTAIGISRDYRTMYVGGGIASVLGILVWITSPTKYLSYDCQMTIKRIKHLENMKEKYDVSLNLFQPRDIAGIGISLKF